MHGLFIAEGTKLAQELIDSSLQICNIYATTQWFIANRNALADKKEIEAEEVSAGEMERISQLKTPQEVLLLVKIPEYEAPATAVAHELELLLESIRDPGNMGTIIRLADWYGLKQIICSPDCADAYNPKTVQASMGSIARVQVHYTELPDYIQKQKLSMYAAVLDGKHDVHRMEKLKDNPALLIGNEGSGLSTEISSLATDTIKIPRFGHAESLNAAMATGILLDNMKRIAGKS